MIYTRQSVKAMMTAPHHLAAEAGADVLRNGGNAVEAMVAAAAAIAVVYPHMNSIGGDGFWLISEPGKPVRAIEACGPAAKAATLDYYREKGLSAIPARGPQAALSVAGTVSGWAKALEVAKPWGRAMELSDLLASAIQHAKDGVVVTKGQEELTAEKISELKAVSGFAQTYLDPQKKVLAEGEVLKQPALAASLEQLVNAGLDDFYRGDLARLLAEGLQKAGSPLALCDLEGYQAREVTPLQVLLSCGQVYNMPPPTQGVSSLMILGLFDRLGVKQGESFEHLHGLIEATKQAFIVRNANVCDPAFMAEDAQDWLRPGNLNQLATRINAKRALGWPYEPAPGDTIWMGCADHEGRVVSFIQSIYWEYGSGIVPQGSGIVWQNRGMSFSLDEKHFNALQPGKLPFHTLNPAMARLKDGRTLSYGTMGGEGQPQTQSALFSRYVMFDTPLQEAISAPRWLLGRTWGDDTTTLKLEDRFDPALVAKLCDAGHEVEMMAPFTSVMGHAGAVCVKPCGVIEGANDPRSDGCAIAL